MESKQLTHLLLRRKIEVQNDPSYCKNKHFKVKMFSPKLPKIEELLYLNMSVLWRVRCLDAVQAEFGSELMSLSIVRKES